MKHKLVAISALALLSSTFNAYAACPKSVAGSYVLYGNKSGDNYVSSRGGLITFGPTTNSIGSVTGQVFVYSEIGTGSGSVTGELQLAQSGPKYTYDGKCFGYLWQPSDSDKTKLQIDFFFVSDSGTQIIIIDGPNDISQNSAGNPLTPLPSTWEAASTQTGVTTLRKQ